MMDDINFVTEPQPITLKEYYEKHGNNYPSFLKVIQGYLGDNEMETLASGQDIRINSCVQHSRVIGIDSHKRTLSIPVDYQILFNVYSNGKRQKGTSKLSDIILKYGLPVVVQIAGIENDSSVAREQLESKLHALGQITLTESYEERYFLSNSVTQGRPSETHLIPLYLKDIKVAKLTGIKGQTPAKWLEYKHFVNSQIVNVTVPPDSGLTEIAIYSALEIKNSENVYDFIEPSSYIYANWDVPDGPKQHRANRVPVLPPKPHTQMKKAAWAMPHSDDSVPPILPKRVANTPPNPPPTGRRASSNEYVNDIERAAVKPFAYLSQATEKGTTGKVAANAISTVQSNINNAGNESCKDTKPVQLCTISELGHRLEALKLGKHVNKFRDQGVDGALAMEFDESILREDFKFTKFDCLKFLNFVKTGHIPH